MLDKEKIRRFRAGMRVSRLDHNMAQGYVQVLGRNGLTDFECLILFQDFRIQYEDIMTAKAKEVLEANIALRWTLAIGS